LAKGEMMRGVFNEISHEAELHASAFMFIIPAWIISLASVSVLCRQKRKNPQTLHCGFLKTLVDLWERWVWGVFGWLYLT